MPKEDLILKIRSTCGTKFRILILRLRRVKAPNNTWRSTSNLRPTKYSCSSTKTASKETEATSKWFGHLCKLSRKNSLRHPIIRWAFTTEIVPSHSEKPGTAIWFRVTKNRSRILFCNIRVQQKRSRRIRGSWTNMCDPKLMLKPHLCKLPRRVHSGKIMSVRGFCSKVRSNKPTKINRNLTKT